MRDRTFVTGFLAFGGIVENPSAALAAARGRRHALLEVAFDAVDEFLDRAAGDDSFDRLLMIGVCGHGSLMQFEQIARNHVGALPDVRGHVRGPRAIEPAGPGHVATTLWTGPMCEAMLEIAHASVSHDAGSYVCNYAYYRALRRLPHKRVGFLHVPPVEALPLEAQKSFVLSLIERLEAD